MPATKNKMKSASAAVSASIPNNTAGSEVLTLTEAASYLRFAEEDIIRLVREQGLPGRQVDREWRFLKSALQEWLRAPLPSLKRQEEQMQWAGAFREDPDLQEIVREAYRQRGRPITEAGE